ncbi:flagellar assembly protein FliW [Alkaliphilus hydrothermalis]|uniref:Flagellar assembly factor FliW n=1 Tax=Alkaliphilus hydrothermalis TaxID=1482730 RepID=A0ABS2NR22_9FIRM|nr:flagellar assembly protein FliW [Alkaliphilus hydrothermalis]MBM7615371.1 flagellar assembly factor FliW [Alkaliphilus hydrothermalis]
MILNTSNFGEIEVKEESVISFPDGLPAFEEYKRYVIIENPDVDIPFHWLQSVEDGDLAFVIINPFIFKKGYDFEIPQTVIEKLEIAAPEEVMVYSIVVVPENISKMTANLKGPIIINKKNLQGKQILLDHDEYQTKHYILEEMKQVG